MITKLLPLHSLDSITDVLAYIRDPDHPRHRHITLGEQAVLGLGGMGESDYFNHVAEEIDEENQTVRRGRALTVMAYHGIARTPPVKVPPAVLTKKERELVPVDIHRKVEAKLISQAHLHPTGDVDWHFLLFRRWARKPSPRSLFRRAMDEIHDSINDTRKHEHRPLLPTVEDGRLQRLMYQGFSPMARQLAEWGTTTVDNLGEALTSLGHHLGSGGIDLSRNIAQVVHQQDATEKAYSYNLSRLLDEAQKAREYCEGQEDVALDLDTPDVDI